MTEAIGTLHDSMRPILTAVIAAIEACAVALAGMLVVALPALALWLANFDMNADPTVVLGGSASAWLLAHFIPLQFRISPEIALGFGLPPESVDFVISLAPLGVTLITVLLAGRAGLRFARDGGSGAAGVLGGTLGFSAASFVLSRFAVAIAAVPVWMILVVPAAVYSAAALTAFFVRAIRDEHPWWRTSVRWVLRHLARAGIGGVDAIPRVVQQAFRLAGATLASLIALAALSLAAAIMVGYIEITTLTQSLQLDVLGIIVIFLLQVALLPVLCSWAIAWWSGAGFAIGVGSSVSPFDVLTGPLPSLPILGAIPQGWGSAAILAPTLVVILTLGIGVLSVRLTGLRQEGWIVLVSVPVLAAALTGLAVTALTALSRGSIGPDRLSTAGAEPWTVGGLIAAEVGAGLLLGILAGRIDRERVADLLAVRDRADPVAESTYLRVAKSPSREMLFRKASRRKRSSDANRAADIPPPGDDLVPADSDAAAAETVPVETVSAETVAAETVPVDTTSFETPPDESTPDETVPIEMPPVDESAGAEVAEADDADGTDDLTEVEEAELLRAFSWDHPHDAAEDEPERRGWRWPRPKG